jgi:hypothetical protein
MLDIVSGIWKLSGSLFGLFDLQSITLEYTIGWKGKREQSIECHCPMDEWRDNSTIMDWKKDSVLNLKWFTHHHVAKEYTIFSLVKAFSS